MAFKSIVGSNHIIREFTRKKGPKRGHSGIRSDAEIKKRALRGYDLSSCSLLDLALAYGLFVFSMEIGLKTRVSTFLSSDESVEDSDRERASEGYSMDVIHDDGTIGFLDCHLEMIRGTTVVELVGAYTSLANRNGPVLRCLVDVSDFTHDDLASSNENLNAAVRAMIDDLMRGDGGLMEASLG